MMQLRVRRHDRLDLDPVSPDIAEVVDVDQRVGSRQAPSWGGPKIMGDFWVIVYKIDRTAPPRPASCSPARPCAACLDDPPYWIG